MAPTAVSSGVRVAREKGASDASNYTHTHVAVYTVALATLGVIFTDSTRGILEKYHINKKWFYLYGAIFFSAYTYVKPFIRQSIGSAQSGRINFYSVYLVWLLSAWVYHLPGFAALGIDIKADLSLLLLVFFGSFVTLTILHVLYSLAVTLKLIKDRLFSRSARPLDRINVCLVNSMSFGLACSTYYSVCGNTGQEAAGPHLENVCSSLKPVRSEDYPAFSNWVLYGELVNSTRSVVNSSLSSEIIGATGGQAISPVLTLWLTLLTLFTANCLGDHWASCTVNAPSHLHCSSRARPPRPRQPRRYPNQPGLPPQGAAVSSVPTDTCGETTSPSGMLSWVSELFGGSKATEPLPMEGTTAEGLQSSDAHPNFLPMVAWFSGTSADLLKTFFDLVISLKVFLGRFDMREMQAATSAAEINRPLPNGCDGDGFTYEHFSEKEELWLDFCADTGDGGNSTYAVARAMAAPELRVKTLQGREQTGGTVHDKANRNSDTQRPVLSACWIQAYTTLPRASLLLIGGDLAYPNPSDYSYEKRLFRPFEDALPPPRHYHPGRVVLHKPDLPPDHPAFSLCDCDLGKPGEIMHAGPMQHQAEQRGMGSSWSCRSLRHYEGPQCFAIPGNHDWIDGLETFMRHITCKGWLGGWMMPQEKSYFALHLPQGWWIFGLDLGLENDIDIFQYRYFAHLAESRLSEGDNVVLMTHQPLWLAEWFHQRRQGSNLRQLVHGHLRGRVPVHMAGDLHFYMRHSLSQSSPTPTAATDSPGCSPEPKEPEKCGLNRQSSVHNLSSPIPKHVAQDEFPDHLIVNGAGGAFLHPTHVFAEASWYAKHDSAAESIASMHQCKGCGEWSRGTSTGSSPRGYSLTVPAGWEGLFPMMPAPVRQLPAPVSAPTSSASSFKYSLATCYPSVEVSKRLGRGNIHLFRRANMKFDVIGGVWYFLLVVGAVPRCSSTSAILDAPSFTDAVLAFASAAGDALQHIFLESYVSLGACIGLFLALMALAKAGGFGIVEQDPGNERSRKSNPGYAETYKMRSGGIATQALVALVHTSVHLSMAIGLMIALDLGIETCIRYGDLGAEGYHGLYNWYRAFEAQHFPDPNNVRGKLETFTLHLYPACLKWLMSLFDLPEAVALGRATMCSSGYNSLNRLESLGYYLGMLAYYWVLATPAIAAIFGCYLYVCVCWFHVHFDEGFSSLRIPHHKGFLRLHISKEGKLHIWALAIDQVPEHWTEDPRWHGFLGGADKRSPSYKAKYPSRWQPDTSLADRSTSEVQVVDHLVVSKKTPLVDQTLKSPCIAPLNLGQCWGDLRI